MRVHCSVCILVVWAISTGAPSACLTQEQQVVRQADSSEGPALVFAFRQVPYSGAITAERSDAPHAPLRQLHAQAADDTQTAEAQANAAQHITTAAAAVAAGQRRADAAGGTAAADSAVADAAQGSRRPTRGRPDSEAHAGPRLTRSEAHQLLNRTSTATPKLMRRMPPEGKAAMERHRTCGAFWMRPVRSVALVGNGPLTEQQRLEVAAADVVIRLNKMNNRFCGERLDVWLLRHSSAAETRHGWHGVGELAHCSTPEALSHDPTLWLFGGSSWWFNPYTVVDAAVAYPQIAQRLTWQGIPFAPWKNLYQTYVAPLGSPSTGWIGLMLALDCKPAGAALHLYGYNWSRRHWHSHAIAAEERFVRLLADLGRLTVHETACNGLRFCGDCNVVAKEEALRANVTSTNGTNSSIPCSSVQVTSQGELSTHELLRREPEDVWNHR